MSGDYIPELVQQMSTERADLVARIGLLDGALEALHKVYPNVFPLPGRDRRVSLVVEAPAVDQAAGLVEQLAELRAQGSGLMPIPAPAPTKVNNQKPRGKPQKTSATPATEGKPGLSGADQAVITLVAANNGLTPSEVADRLGFTYQTAYGKLQRLVSLGKIRRTADKLYYPAQG